ncbi:cupin domain-containing protein [Streptomyces sp. NPDC058655]|uniref:cupin domain-containing protein n=1 Tax=Streptomyces sp. NPDC058655 TaxID=3346577 RepID=UPI0036484E99
METTASAGWTFEELAGDPGTFYSGYFGKQPLLRRGALARRTEELLSVGRLDDLLAMETVPPAYLRVARNGQGVSSKAYTRVVRAGGAALSETVVPEQVYELFRSGATVTWNYLHHLLPSARRLVDTLAQSLGAPAEAVAFLTPAGHDGYAPHHDPVDVFVVQTSGTKHWRVWDRPEASRGDSATYTAEELGAPALQTTLHPGDVLYLPYGTPHAAAAGDQVSLHLSLTVERRRWRDLLAETVQQVLADEAFADSVRPDRDLDGPAHARMTALLCERLAAAAPAAPAPRPQGGTRPPREFQRLASLTGLTPAARLRRSPVPVELGRSDGGKTRLTAAGHTVAVPDAVAGALRLLEAGGSLPAGELFPGASEPRSLSAAASLTRLGVLEPVPATGGTPR